MPERKYLGPALCGELVFSELATTDIKSMDLPEGRKEGLGGQKVGGEGLHCHQEHHRKYLKYKI